MALDRSLLVAHATTQAVADAIEALRVALRAEYRSDFSFEVHGQGYTLAASNQRLGELYAQAGGGRDDSVYR